MNVSSNAGELDDGFFPAGAGRSGVRKELKDDSGRRPEDKILQPEIKSEEDYRRGLIEGYLESFHYLSELPRDAILLGSVHLKELHARLLRRIYRVAGRWRIPGEVVMFGGKIAPFHGEIPWRIERLIREAAGICGTWNAPLAENAPDYEYHDRIAFIAFFHAKFIHIHPFRDGNGRVGRLVAWWHEMCFFERCFTGRMKQKAAPRHWYIKGLDCSKTDLRILANFFAIRHGLDYSLNPLSPPWPILDKAPL